MANILYKGKTIATECQYNGDGNMLEFLFDNNLNNTSPNSWALPGLSPSLLGSAGYSTTAKNGTHSLNLPGNTSSYVRCLSNNTSPLNLGNEDFTFSMWFRFATLPGTGNTVTLFSRHRNGGYSYMLIPNLNGFTWAKNNIYTVDVSGLPNFVINTWYNVAVVKSSGIRKIYLNGVQVGNGVVDNTPYNAVNTDLEIGRNGDEAWPFNGQIDDFRFYKRAEYTANFTPI
jgi:hypothetical protein